MTTETKKDRTPAGAPSTGQLDNTLASIILSNLSMASENHPITRAELAQIIPAGSKDPDRVARKYIQQMRRQGIRICSTPGGSGYWLETDNKKARAFLKRYKHGAIEILKTAKAMEDAMRAEEEMALYEKMREEYDADPANM